jgi:drug/metabolite transporter (DMT)-like permease
MAVCVIWGTTYLAIRIALETIPPGLLGGIRFTIAGLALSVVVRLRGHRLPPASEWPMQALIGVLMLGIGNGFVVVAEQWIPSGIAAVGVASAPFWMTGIESAAGGERLTPRTLIGFLIGFSGIVVLIWPDLFHGGSGGFTFVAGIVLAQLACLGWSIGSSLSKRFTPAGTALAASAIQQMCGGVATLLVGSLVGEWNHLTFTSRSLSAELYLIVFGSLGAYSAYVYALQHLSVATVPLYAYINPVIAVVLGAVIANEPFGPRVMAAAAMVLAGVAVVRSGR